MWSVVLGATRLALEGAVLGWWLPDAGRKGLALHRKLLPSNVRNVATPRLCPASSLRPVLQPALAWPTGLMACQALCTGWSPGLLGAIHPFLPWLRLLLPLGAHLWCGECFAWRRVAAVSVQGQQGGSWEGSLAYPRAWNCSQVEEVAEQMSPQ